MSKVHTHWTVIAYNEIDANGNYPNAVELTINDALNEEWAINEAKGLVERKGYVLRKVWECYNCNPNKNKLEERLGKFIDQQINNDDE